MRCDYPRCYSGLDNARKGQVTIPPPSVIMGAFLWNRYSMASHPTIDEIRHPNEHHCLDWDINVNDRYQNLELSRKLLVHSFLPWNVEYTKELPPSKLVDHLAII